MLRGQVDGVGIAVVVFIAVALLALFVLGPPTAQIFTITGDSKVSQLDEDTFLVQATRGFANVEAGSDICLQLKDQDNQPVSPDFDPSKATYESDVIVRIGFSEKNVFPPGDYEIPDGNIYNVGSTFCFVLGGAVPNWGTCCPKHEGEIFGSFKVFETECGNGICESVAEDMVSCPADCAPQIPPPPPPPSPGEPVDEPDVDESASEMFVIILVAGMVAIIIAAVAIAWLK